MKHFSVVLLAALVAGCGLGRMLDRSVPLEVREVGRSLYCNTPGEQARVTLLPDLQSALDWQASRNIVLAPAESLAQVPYALVEMGARPTGGYGLAIARAAKLDGEQVLLSATFLSPSPGSIRTQALSSPCVLVALPRGRYDEIVVRDETGEVRARGGRAQAPIPVEPPAPDPAAPAETPAAATPAT